MVNIRYMIDDVDAAVALEHIDVVIAPIGDVRPRQHAVGIHEGLLLGSPTETLNVRTGAFRVLTPPNRAFALGPERVAGGYGGTYAQSPLVLNDWTLPGLIASSGECQMRTKIVRQ